MTRAEKVREAARLRAEGLPADEIAKRMGARLKTVYDWLNDPDGSKLRARKDSYRGTCETCGAATNGSDGKAKAPKRCAECEQSRNEDRNRRVVEAWERGDTVPVIAGREGMTHPQVYGVIGYLRGRKGVSVVRHYRPNRQLWPLIERRWREGATGPEIAAEAGTSPGNIWMTIQRMRNAGIDLPVRHHPTLAKAA